MFDKNVLHLAEVLEKWSTEGYPCLDEKDFADEKVEYARLYFAAKEGDEQAKKRCSIWILSYLFLFLRILM